MKRDIFIGGAWPYANYYLHIGHLAALLPGDIIAKYYRLNNDNVIYVSGSDCHGTPITQRAKKENKTPEEVANHYHEEFIKTFEKIGFNYDMYSSTMTSFHNKFVKDCYKKILDNGYIYEKNIEQDYCENCKAFLSDRDIEGTCPKCHGICNAEQCEECLTSLDPTEVIDKHCKNCKEKVVTKKNKHLYFKLSAFSQILQELLNKNSEIWRKNAVGETQKFLDMGLIDRATTRQLEWGIEVPVEGYNDKRIYVWIEAVLGYLSVCNEVTKNRNIDFDKFMSNDNQNLRTYYIHGKDNIVFHTIIYPALLSSLNKNYKLPDYIVSSAYMNINNEKMSKSTGNLITVNELLEKYNKDTIRFYLILNGPETKDTNCSFDEIKNTHNKFLVGVLGNFINRNLSFINKKFDGIITEGIIDNEIILKTKHIYKEVGSLIEKAELKNAINLILEYISLGNKYYDENEPWIKVKENTEEFNNITYTCVYMINNIANLISPFMEESSLKIKRMLNIEKINWEEETIKGNIKINNIKLLFERIDE